MAQPARAGVLAAVSVVLLVAACSPNGFQTQETREPATSLSTAPSEAEGMAAAVTTDSQASDATSPPETSAAPRDCSPRAAPAELDFATAAVPLSIEISRALYECADEVGLAFARDPATALTVAAHGIRGPLLLIESWSAAAAMDEIQRLAPERIIAAGFSEQILELRLAGYAVEQVPVDPEAALPVADTAPERLLVVDDASQAAVIGAVGSRIGVAAVAVAGDLRALAFPERQLLRNAAHVETHTDLGPDAAWQLEVIRRGDELPGGGLLMFGPDGSRRIVAIYGHPTTSQLGVLGEQGPDDGVARLRSIAEGYDADGREVILAFEIIATVASAQAGRDGDYSNETDLDVLRPWIETAAANDMYVVLDLQSGRTDFLTQAKQYEEFLRLPHVGLALDPEWRLKPGQRHLRQIGTVDAAEINQVSAWLADLVRTEALPQKLLLLHQFRFSMITNRELIETPPELAVMIHMDGQGPLNTKYTTWDALLGLPDADRYYWGWKNFYDEDSPTATAAQVLELTPPPLFVSYQ